MADAIRYGVVAIFALLLGSSAVYVLTAEEQQKAYVCSTTDVVGIFERLSATSKTGYWTVNATEKSTVCRNGVWEPLAAYMARTGKTLEQLVQYSEPAVEPVRVLNVTQDPSMECQPKEVTKYYQQNLSITQDCSAPVRNNATGMMFSVCSTWQENITRQAPYIALVYDCHPVTGKEVPYAPPSVCGADCSRTTLIAGKSVPYKRPDRSCWKEADVMCCLSNTDGGLGIDSRAKQFRLSIRDGECGFCKNITADKIISEGRCEIGERVMLT